MAWYEGTRDTKAEIVTLEYSPKMIAASREAFKKYGVGDRVKLIEGPAENTLKTLEGEFDLIFVDANKDGYAGYVKTILDQGLLSANGIILCDNGKPFLTLFSKANADLKQSLPVASPSAPTAHLGSTTTSALTGMAADRHWTSSAPVSWRTPASMSCFSPSSMVLLRFGGRTGLSGLDAATYWGHKTSWLLGSC